VLAPSALPQLLTRRLSLRALGVSRLARNVLQVVVVPIQEREEEVSLLLRGSVWRVAVSIARQRTLVEQAVTAPSGEGFRNESSRTMMLGLRATVAWLTVVVVVVVVFVVRVEIKARTIRSLGIAEVMPSH
jgi:hypothetical protein